MLILRKFLLNERGNSMQTVAVAAGAIAFASLAGTQFLDRSVQSGALQQMAGLRGPADFSRTMSTIPRPVETGRESLRQVSVDYTPTGSIPTSLSQPIILDPCTGMRK